MITITTKYLPATNRRGSRIKADAEALKRLLELCENGEGSDMYGIEGAHKAIAIAEGK